MKTARVWLLMLAAALRPAAAQGAPPLAVLWVPPESFADWRALDQALLRHGDLRLTVGLSPGMVSPEAERTLSAWTSKGRLEVALRIPGDPVLPLIAGNPSAPRPEDPVRRVAFAREQYRLALSSMPAGLVPGGGAVSPDLFAGFKAMGLSWVAVGEYAGSTAAWAAGAGVTLVPCRAVRTQGLGLSAEDLAPEPPEPGALVVDEADGLVSAGAFLRLLERESPRRPWATVRETVSGRQEALRDAAGVRDWPTWAGGYDEWSSSASQRSWALYAEAALALDRYQNSGAADLKVLESATDELYLAQASRFYRLPEPHEKEFRAHLMAVYRRIKLTPPETLYAPLAAQGQEQDAGGQGEVSTDIHLSRGAGWIAFDNPAGSFARAPDEAPAAGDGRPPDEPWRIRTLRVEAREQGTLFAFRMARLDGGPSDPGGMGSLLLDAYIDLNHMVGAGSLRLLEGRDAFALARDAWEYALSVSRSGALLYRSNPGGAPVLAGKLPVTVDLEMAEVRVLAPKTLLHGNPQRWGYIVLATALDPRTVGKGPPQPLRSSRGGNILGLLAPLERQRTLLTENLETGKRRLAAVRAAKAP